MLAQRTLSGGGTANALAAELPEESTQRRDAGALESLGGVIEKEPQVVRYGSVELQSQQ